MNKAPSPTEKKAPNRLAATLLAATAIALALALPASAAASPAQTLTVFRNGTGIGTGIGTVTSSPAGIDCGETCSASFAQGAAVTLTASLGPGAQTVKWIGCDSVSEGKCTLTMSSSRSVTVTFGPAYALSVAKAGTGTGTVTSSSPAGIACGATCTASFLEGTSVTLTAAPGLHTLPAQWAGCDSVEAGKCTVRMSAARTVTATFNPKPGFPSFAVAIEKAGTGTGTVTSSVGGIACGEICSTQLVTGTVVTLTAVPDHGSVFAHWSGGGCKGASPCTISIGSAQTVKATFTAVGTRTLSVAKAGNGQGTVTANAVGIDCGQTCSANVAVGKKVTLSAKAAKGSSFAHWSGACAGTAKTCAVTVNEARSVTATFSGSSAPAPPPPSCVVPKLKGKSPSQARTALTAAHCALGKLRKPKGAKGTLVVRSSTPGAGTKLAAGAKVGVKLAKAHKRRHG